MLPRALLLDAGNTIVFFDVDVVSSILHDLGLDVSPAALRRAEREAKLRYERELVTGGKHADSWYGYMSTLLEESGVPPDRVSATVTLLRLEHDRFNLWRAVPPGLPAALDRVRAAGTRTGVVSNSEGAIAELLEAVGLASRLEIIVDSGVLGVQKPDPRIWHHALERLDVAPADALYVGDIPSVDVEGARRAGLAGVLIDTHGQYDGDPRVADGDPGTEADPRTWRQGPVVRFRSVVDLVTALAGPTF